MPCKVFFNYKATSHCLQPINIVVKDDDKRTRDIYKYASRTSDGSLLQYSDITLLVQKCSTLLAKRNKILYMHFFCVTFKDMKSRGMNFGVF